MTGHRRHFEHDLGMYCVTGAVMHHCVLAACWFGAPRRPWASQAVRHRRARCHAVGVSALAHLRWRTMDDDSKKAERF